MWWSLYKDNEEDIEDWDLDWGDWRDWGDCELRSSEDGLAGPPIIYSNSY